MLTWDDEGSNQKSTPVVSNGNVRFTASEKRIINGHTDVNQLVPFKYKWAWEKYLATCANHWMPQEIPMAADIALWKNPSGLSEDERRIIKRNLGFFVTADSLAANNIVLGTYRHITAPECRQFLLRQAFEEAIHCYAEGTEILTPRGFVDFRKLVAGEKVAQYHKSGKISFVVPDEILKDKYEGKMIRFYNEEGSFEKVVTPEHRCVTRNPRKNNKLEITLAKELSPANRNFPTSGSLVGKRNRLTWFEKLNIAYQADGHLGNSHVEESKQGSVCGYRTYVWQLKKQRKIIRIQRIADALGYESNHNPITEGANKGHSRVIVRVPVQDGSLSKDFDWIDLSKISADWAEMFLAEVGHWDGCRRDNGSMVYTTTNLQNGRTVQTLAHLCGKRAGWYKVPVQGNRQQAVQVHVYDKKHASGKAIRKEEIDYSGHVYCVGVPTGMIVTRYNGKIAVSGNTHAYQYIVESLSMDESEIFNAYREIPSIKNKDDFLIPFIDVISDPLFKTGTTENDQKLLKSLIVFACLMEGLFFYVGFTQILSMGRQNKMIGASKQYAYILRDESMHCNFGIDLINQIKIENPDLWTKEFVEEVVSLFRKAVDLECAYADDTMPRGVLGLNASSFKGYMKFIANRRAAQIGIGELYKGAENTFPWMSEMLDLQKEENFFEKRPIDYQTGGGLQW